MHATTCVHDGVPNPVLHETDVVFHDPRAFHPAHGRFDPDADGRDPPIGLLFNGYEFPSPRCLLGLEARDPMQDDSLEALLLIQTPTGWQGVAHQLRQALIRCFAFTGVAQ